jgi:acyl dehydratase
VAVTRALAGPPGTLGLYARAGAAMVPGAGRLPFVSGRGSEVPDLELTLPERPVDPDHLARYARACGFRLRDELPPTYPHVLAFPLHMAVMTDPAFPFPAVGLVHIENRIVCHRPISVREPIALRVAPLPVEPHPRGRSFAIVTEARAGDELVWEEVSTMLRRGGGGDEPSGPAPGASGAAFNGEPPVPSATWRLDAGLGRRYAAASGDRNPIHLHALSAKAFGFPRAIAHGMWTKARALAALEGRLPAAYAVDVRFRKPILLPGTVTFASSDGGSEIRFAVRDQSGEKLHLDGAIQPLTAPEAA